MLIIGHRGAAGDQLENTYASLQAGIEADADLIEFDVRLTKDKVPVLVHDPNLWRTHRIPYFVNRITYPEIKKRTARSKYPVLSFEDALKNFSGQIMLNLHVKRGSAKVMLPILQKYIKRPKDWDMFLISSFFVRDLAYIRKRAPQAQLGLLHLSSPLTFLRADRKLSLAAVGFHRLHINSFVITIAKRMGLLVYVYTVNRPEAAERLQAQGVDAIVTDHPHQMREHFTKLEAAEALKE
jgi:glycerophosphoryl diester phosphodiesterase